MSWASLFQSVRPCEPVGEGTAEVLRLIEKFDPMIYWYPGSGCDLVPLLLDVPDNPTGCRLYPLRGPDQRGRIILWMNDYAEWNQEFPTVGEFKADDFNKSLWERFSARAEIQNVFRFVIQPSKNSSEPVPLSIFHVRVQSDTAVWHDRQQDGDLYTVLYSAAESEHLLATVFSPHQLDIQIVALVRQGGFSCQRAHFEPRSTFEQYRDIPRLLRQHQNTVGAPKHFILDRDDMDIPGYSPTKLHLKDWGCHGATLWSRDQS